MCGAAVNRTMRDNRLSLPENFWIGRMGRRLTECLN
ncbi:hypothetical protein LMG28138_00129 [Pararobbsia alpina]|uniref:Uncharacterized protein n=1 Tax=Pararobbsia alpina TaxID=621374 RepID=A0A6S7AXI5_9BURK|nr:hypothetical protein LMG28138_00129 [Pararobbsia alpina]